MALLKISKVNALPGVLTPSTLYLVSDAVRTNDVKIYVSDSTGTASKHVPTFAELESMVDAKVAAGVTAGVNAATALRVVADITARDALAPTVTTLALVLDATDDTTVASGAATYVFDGTVWTKISEHESLDVVVTWASISGKPTSAVADIDDAVTKRHAHANSAVLALLTDVSGALQYNGAPVAPQMVAEEW